MGWVGLVWRGRKGKKGWRGGAGRGSSTGMGRGEMEKGQGRAGQGRAGQGFISVSHSVM